MLGLIQKDIYQMLKYQRVLMLIVIAFAATCAWNLDNAFFMVYPSVISAMSVVTLQSYDERSGFTCYSRVMPISIKTIVGEKYLCGAGLILLVCLIEAASFLVLHHSMVDTIQAIGFIFAVGLLSLSLFVPFAFAFGVERGRIAYTVALGVFCALAFLIKDRFLRIPMVTLGSAILICILLTVVSYVISVIAYGRRAL